MIRAIFFLFWLGLIAFGVVKLFLFLARRIYAKPGPDSAIPHPETVGIYTRFTDTAAAILWPFPPPAKVRLAFPCPACFQPLLGKVAPGEELICPWCKTTFQTPEPPPAAPPLPRKVLKENSPKKSFSLKGFIRGTSIVFGIIIYISLVITALVDFPVLWLLLLGILLVGWIIQGLYRRFIEKDGFLPKTILGPGGGNIFAGELLRTTIVIGFPFTLILVFWLFGACCLMPVFGGLGGIFWGW